MTITTGTMTREQRKSVALEYFKRFDHGEDVLDLFAEDAVVFYLKWCEAYGQPKIARLFADVSKRIQSINCSPEYLNFIIDEDMVIIEGCSTGVAANGTEWHASDTYAGCCTDVFEIRDHKTHRCYVCPEPDLLPQSELTVRVNGAAMTVAGGMLELGIAPQAVAAALAGSLVPTTQVCHPFWKEEGEARTTQKIQFMKNLAMLGGLLLVMSDND